MKNRQHRNSQLPRQVHRQGAAFVVTEHSVYRTPSALQGGGQTRGKLSLTQSMQIRVRMHLDFGLRWMVALFATIFREVARVVAAQDDRAKVSRKTDDHPPDARMMTTAELVPTNVQNPERHYRN